MRIAVTGRTGQVASALAEIGAAQDRDIVLLGRPELDLAQPARIFDAIAAVQPDVIASVAAYTAVDKAESEAEMAEAVNGTGPGAVAEAAAQLGIPVIHISTDYVFDGTSADPYAETDATGPANVYGRTKLHGEQNVAAATPDHVILRVAWVYSPFGGNFVKTMLRLGETRDELGVVADQIGGPTSALDIARAVLAIADRLASDPAAELRGVFHLSPMGEASWADFAEAIFSGAAERGLKPCRVRRITTADYPTPARRPANSRLAAGKLAAAYGIRLPHWRESLETCLDRLIPAATTATIP